MANEGVIYFVDFGAAFSPTATGFVLTKAWALIEAVPAPNIVSLPNLASIPVQPAPIPAGIPGAGTIGFLRLVVMCVALFVVVSAPKAWFVVLVAGWIAWAAAGSVGDGPRTQERSKRQRVRDDAQQTYDRVVEQIQRESGPQGFSARRQALTKLRDEYAALPQAEQRELMALQSTAQERQKQKFLDAFFIDSATIPGMGPARKAALRSFGIETAADVERNKIRQIRGFGDSLTSAVTDWRASCERRFVFNPKAGVSAADKTAVQIRFNARKLALESQLYAGTAELERFRQAAATTAEALQPQLTRAAAGLAQAVADLKVLAK